MTLNVYACATADLQATSAAKISALLHGKNRPSLSVAYCVRAGREMAGTL